MKAKARVLAMLAAVTGLGLLFLWRPRPFAHERPQAVATRDASRAGNARAPDLPSQPASAATAVQVPIRDLADGSLLPHFKVRLGSQALETDESGRMRVTTMSGTFEPADPAAVLVPAKAARVVEEGTLWVYRTFRVRGHVSGPGTPPLDPTQARLEATWQAAAVAAAPWTWDWLYGHRVPLDRWFTEGTGADGAFDIEMPCIPGFTIRASAAGWRPAWAAIVVDARKNVADIDLVLLPAFRVRGRVADIKGRPLAAAPVVVYVVRHGKLPDIGADESGVEWNRGSGAAVRTYKSNGAGDVTISLAGLTDAQGRFDFDIDTEGEGLLWVQHAGYATHYLSLGTLRGDANPIEVALEPAFGKRVRVLRSGKPAKETSLSLADLEFPEIQPTFVLRTDADGNAPAEWLVVGHLYAVRLGGLTRELSWNGQAEVDVEGLPEVRPP